MRNKDLVTFVMTGYVNEQFAKFFNVKCFKDNLIKSIFN